MKILNVIRASKVLFLLVTELDLEFELKNKRNDLYIFTPHLSLSLSFCVCGCVCVGGFVFHFLFSSEFGPFVLLYSSVSEKTMRYRLRPVGVVLVSRLFCLSEQDPLGTIR